MAKDLLRLAQEELSERGGVSFDGEALIRVLEGRLTKSGTDEVTVQPGHLVEYMKDQLGKIVTPEQIGLLFRRYGFTGKREKRGTVYAVTRSQLAALCVKLGYEPPDFTPPDPNDPMRWPA